MNKITLEIILSVIVAVMLFNPIISLAFKFTPEVCREYGLGSNWYCAQEKPEEEQNKQNADISAQDILDSNIAPETKATLLNELWETQRKSAVITGEREEIQKFLTTHNLITERGINFAKKVQKVIETNPKLANSESYYKNITEASLKDKEKIEVLRNAANRYGLVFVYSSGCHHCSRQLPIITKFREEYKFKIIGITIDKNYFAGLDENITDNSVINDPMVQVFPTILLLDKKQPEKIFIAKGLTTLDELEQRIVSRIKERENAQNDKN